MEPAVRTCPQCGTEYGDPSLTLCPADGTLLPALEVDPMIGHVVAGRYAIKSKLGQGATGSVYVARQLAMDRDVALKVLKPELASHKSTRARFEREARSASRISSVRVVTMIDYGCSDDGIYFIAMELLDGMNLGELLAVEGRLPPFESVRIATEIARALDAAHESSVVHRDLKPENVLLTAKELAIKVLDFGIAKMLSEQGDLRRASMTGAILGTPAYISPEAVTSENVGPEADLYALGVMLFEMLAGRRPFAETAPILLFDMHVKLAPPRLSEVAPGLPCGAELESLVSDLLEKDPKIRPNAVQAVARLEKIGNTLAQLGEGERTSLGALKSRATPAPVPVAPRRAPIALFAVLGAVLVVALLATVALIAVVKLGGNDTIFVTREPEPVAAAQPMPTISMEVVAEVSTSVNDAGPPAVLPPAPAPVEVRPRIDPLRHRVPID